MSKIHVSATPIAVAAECQGSLASDSVCREGFPVGWYFTDSPVGDVRLESVTYAAVLPGDTLKRSGRVRVSGDARRDRGLAPIGTVDRSTSIAITSSSSEHVRALLLVVASITSRSLHGFARGVILQSLQRPTARSEGEGGGRRYVPREHEQLVVAMVEAALAAANRHTRAASAAQHQVRDMDVVTTMFLPCLQQARYPTLMAWRVFQHELVRQLAILTMEEPMAADAIVRAWVPSEEGAARLRPDWRARHPRRVRSAGGAAIGHVEAAAPSEH